MKTIHGRLDTIAADLEGLMGQLGLHGDYSMPANRQMGCLVNEPIVYGRDEEREKVIELLGIPHRQSNNENDSVSVSAPTKRRKKENVSVLSIYGIGGVGKTTLAQIVYNDQRVADHFDLKIWICVSDNFDANSLSKEIIDNAGKGYETDRMNLSSLQETLKKLVMAHRFLLILDDVWNEDSGEWQKFYAPLSYGQEGSIILVTTRTLKVASIAGTVDPSSWRVCQFKVGKDDQHKIGELKHMTQLHGRLHIKNLENVESKEDACQAELDNKPYLDELILQWSQRASNSHHDMEVLEGLQPHQNLKQLEIIQYGGPTSPVGYDLKH
uniref:Uncharacterized protein n=1 Tax=Ananas comosus var. bracteatus TaxID=296719 RepID=A0A6V7QZ71_ANACO